MSANFLHVSLPDSRQFARKNTETEKKKKADHTNKQTEKSTKERKTSRQRKKGKNIKACTEWLE